MPIVLFVSEKSNPDSMHIESWLDTVSIDGNIALVLDRDHEIVSCSVRDRLGGPIHHSLDRVPLESP